jgi:hypothetical protein
VTAANTKIPHDPSRVNGWEYHDANATGLLVYGTWCDTINGAGGGRVRIVYGCADIDVP